ncbi:MAG: DUF5696 domain-containing protein [Planctomycetota bacterium]|nr:DUF5696 domain-containing protein [Planctomycetota bacterium]
MIENWRTLVMVVVLGMGAEVVAQTTRPGVSLSKNDAGWVIEGRTRRVSIRLGDLAMTVRAGDVVWEMMAAAKDDLTVEVGGKRVELSLVDAKKAQWGEYRQGYLSGVKIELGEFANGGDVGVTLWVGLEGFGEELVCEVMAREGQAVVRQCLWPKGFDGREVDQTVVPYMQGMLLPRDWGKRVYLYDDISYGRGLYMPWWGQVKGGAGAMVILETAADGGCRFEHPAGGPTRLQTKWVHSLGKLGYLRRARVCFLDRGGYVEMAKRYRRYVIESGAFVSLKEKVARSPMVGRVIGGPVIHTSILSHIQPESNYFDKKDAAKNHQVVTFEARAAEFRKLAERGVGRAYVHLDGWGFRGYDNLHPDILPPSAEAGGWEGMKKLAEVCDEIGYVFAVHDNYRDYYHDAASYDPNWTLMDEKGGRPFGHEWWGGNQSILCSKFAAGHVGKNHREILARGVKLSGAYLDVFSVVPGDECYHPEHRVTRGECLRHRGECLDLIRALEGVVSSEEPADWAIRHIDLVHHAPFGLDPNPGGGEAMGVPAPLYSLVYHDALIVPWFLSKGGWGIPKNDSAYLHGMLNAGIPYVSTHADEKELEKVRRMCGLHRRVGMVEMVGHEMLGGRKQRTSFADGTKVTVDFDTDVVEIEPGLSEKEIEAALRR